MNASQDLLEIFVAILRAPIALEKATISWHSEHKIMGMQYGFESALRIAVPGLRSLCLEANDRSVSLSRRPGREFGNLFTVPPLLRVSSLTLFTSSSGNTLLATTSPHIKSQRLVGSARNGHRIE
jgi:hypothetical protein